MAPRQSTPVRDDPALSAVSAEETLAALQVDPARSLTVVVLGRKSTELKAPHAHIHQQLGIHGSLRLLRSRSTA